MKARRSILTDWIKPARSFPLLALLLLLTEKIGRVRFVLLFLLPLFLTGTLAILAFIIVLWPWAIVMLWHKTLTVMAKPAFRVIAVSLIVVLGFLLYLARTYMRPIYGIAEVCIGIATCWAALSYSNLSLRALPASLAMIGGVYIIIRGFDNIIDDKSLIDPFTNSVASVGHTNEAQLDSSAEQIDGRNAHDSEEH